MRETRLETERLVMRMFRADDFDAYARMLADPEVTRYLNEGLPLDRRAAWRNMLYQVGHWAVCEYGNWAVEEQATGRFVGRVGLAHPEGGPGHKLGWTVAREQWGRGYATEAARRALDYAFAELPACERVVASIDPDNAASIKIAERLGMRLEGRGELCGRETLIYGVARGAGGGA